MQKIIILAFLILPLLGNAQKQSIFLGTDIPIQYTLGYNLEFEKVSTQMQFGMLTKPYDDAILNIIEGFGANPDIIDIVRKAFEKGFVFTLKQNYNINRKMYAGIYGQYLSLHAAETPLNIIENYSSDINLTPLWTLAPLSLVGNYGNEFTEIRLESNLLQLGLLFGYRFELNSKFEIKTEFSISKHVFSTNNFSSETPYPAELYTLLDDDISTTYKKYAYIPSINIYFVYKL